MAPNRRDVEFKTLDGLTLRAWLYPAGLSSPCIIMSHGVSHVLKAVCVHGCRVNAVYPQFSGIKHHHLDSFAERFQEEGWTTLVYDNRNWGESDGLPRNEIDPAQQVKDYFDAFDSAVSHPEVDPKRVVYWGSSLSGGNVICAAAIDRRIKAVVAQIPFVSGELQSAPMAGMVPALFANRTNVRAGNPSAMIPVIPDSFEQAETGHSPAVLNTPDAFNFLNGLSERGGNWENKVTLQTMFNILSFEPRAFINRIAPTPFLMVVSENDTTVPTAYQLAAYQQALEPKQLHVIRNTGHFGVYRGLPFEENIKVQIDFLRKNLQ